MTDDVDVTVDIEAPLPMTQQRLEEIRHDKMIAALQDADSIASLQACIQAARQLAQMKRNLAVYMTNRDAAAWNLTGAEELERHIEIAKKALRAKGNV